MTIESQDIRTEDPVLAKKKTDPGLCTSNEGRFFVFYTFGVRRTIDVPGSRTLGLTGYV